MNDRLLLFAFVLWFSTLEAAVSAVHTSLQVPDGWHRLERAPRETDLKLTLALKQRNLNVLDSFFWNVSNPKSASYGKYLKVDDITAIVSPSEETIRTVNKWLDSHDIRQRTLNRNRDFLHINLPVAEAERLLDTEYAVFIHNSTKTRLVRSLYPYTVPERVSPSLDFVIGGIGFPNMDRPQMEDYKRGGPVIPLTPQIVRIRYNVTGSSVGGNANNVQSVVEFMGNYYSDSDLRQFFAQYWPETKFNYSVQRVLGENKNNNPTDNGNQAIQYLMSLAPDIPTWYWGMNGADFWSDIAEWVSAVSNTDRVALVHVITDGNQGEGPSQDYRNRLNVEFQKLGARGLTVIVSSGDSGTGCTLCWYFTPTFPSTSPYVTAVGATQFCKNKVGLECGAQLYHSGGGFSWTIEQPEYQTSLVTHYFATANMFPEGHFYNRNGRGIPDVSALGVGYETIQNGVVKVVHGTGTAAVTWGAIVSLLNEVRLDHFKPPLGFLNPLLYQFAEQNDDAFYDVESGNNHFGCCGWSGFLCTKGWDPVTGLGTPNFKKLAELVRRLPN